MSELIWTQSAQSDLQNIFNYIEEDSEVQATLFLDELISQPENLIEFPNLGRIVPEIGVKSIRELVFESYRIIYRVKNKLIEILRVIHSRRNLHLIIEAPSGGAHDLE